METAVIDARALESEAMMKAKDINVVELAVFVAGLKLGVRRNASRFRRPCIEAVAKQLSVSYQTVYDWIEDGNMGRCRDYNKIEKLSELSCIDMTLLRRGIDKPEAAKN